ncbi:isocitrate dehydrogenase [NAD] subunit gamma, mitochondrial-like isoform X1 [Saccostrea echinata]|uniref:isocitrate dehydrogenase [NAD] subunit gamma, mitochondrial-like isoform X1 n=2 Tax=Saccostrea echinata TaxID=191078 RepID=UPI002A7F393A|nr:isocitrate dehydrogenase [NAD] subunit gamma, mitochondrial-like isoform X1 [Saccostrea echinata]
MAAPMQRSILKLLKSTSGGLKRSISGSNRVTGSLFNQQRRDYSTEPQYSKYGGRTTVTALTGDGVGPELLSYVEEVFRYAGAPVDFENLEINASTSNEETLHSAILSVQRNGIALKGNIESKFDEPGFKSMNVELRTKLDLFASIVWCKSIAGVQTRHQNLDIILIRENTEGEYSNLEYEIVPGCIENLKIITAAKSTKIAKYAFEFAKTHGRKKVTAIHKANIMKLGDGLFLESCRKVACQYPDIEFSDMIVDNASMQMVSKPQQFDVLVMPNLYGNILSNITAGLVGGPGVIPGMNIGDNYAVFEMGTRSSGRSMKGKNIANPTGMLLASCDMLDYIGYTHHAKLIRESVMKVLSEDKIQTPDLGGQATTLEVVQAIIDDIKPKTSSWSSTAAQNIYSLR